MSENSEMEAQLDALDNEWLDAIGENYMRMFGKPWETRDGETREEGLQSNITALFQLIENEKSRADRAEAACAPLSFAALTEINARRCGAAFHPINNWTPTDWACAFAGEAGEACNAVKKLRRIADGTNTSKDPQSESEAIAIIGRELADTVIYADLLATRLGLNLGQCVIDKFNEVSERMNCEIRISTSCGKGWLSPEKRKLAVEALEHIASYPIHSEPMGGAMDMQDIADKALAALKEAK